MKFKKRGNYKGSVMHFTDGRAKPYTARITVGKDINGIAIRHYIGSFENELEAYVCLENYHKEPKPIYIKKSIYDRIATFPIKPYPLVPVENINQNKLEIIKKNTYTFKQLYEEYRTLYFPTRQERYSEKNYNRRTGKKLTYNYSRGLATAYNCCQKLYDCIYKDLKTSDFQKIINESGKKYGSQKKMINLFVHLDNYAIQEDIIEKGYAKYVRPSAVNEPIIKKKVFTYEQIDYLWKIEPRKFEEGFVRDIFLISLYTGMRANEIFLLKNKNIHLKENYLVGGIKTKAGIDREIPIHKKIKPIIEKYYNDKEWLFYMPERKVNGGRKVNYDFYLYHYKLNFIEYHPFLEHHTAHECRHTLRTELEKLNIREIIINSIIGHSNDHVGLDVYTHIPIEDKIEAINQVTYTAEHKMYLFKNA